MSTPATFMKAVKGSGGKVQHVYRDDAAWPLPSTGTTPGTVVQAKQAPRKKAKKNAKLNMDNIGPIARAVVDDLVDANKAPDDMNFASITFDMTSGSAASGCAKHLRFDHYNPMASEVDWMDCWDMGDVD